MRVPEAPNAQRIKNYKVSVKSQNRLLGAWSFPVPHPLQFSPKIPRDWSYSIRSKSYKILHGS
jgi:hypothetical protein